MKRQTGKGGLVKAGDILKPKETRPTPATPATPAPPVRIDPPPIPTDPEFQNSQLSLFQDFLYNRGDERDNLSNAIDLWDSVPRYSVSRLAMTKSREKDKFLENHTAVFHHRGRAYTCTISPARITDMNGEQRDFYPSANEELVEDALRKLATDQQAGFFDKPNYRSGVVFSMYALREELKNSGHTRSYQEVRQALDILSKSIIEISAKEEAKGELLVVSAYLPSLVAVSKKKLEDDPEARWAVHFHPLVTRSIDEVTYRQFDYRQMMKHPSQLARWLHKQLVTKYTFAELSKPFEMRYSTVKRDSGLLNRYSRERAAIEALEAAFMELKEGEVLSSYERKDIAGPRKKLLDVVFKVWPSVGFVKQAKAANKRLADAQRSRSVGIGGGSR